MIRFLCTFLLCALTVSAGMAQERRATERGPVIVQQMISGLDQPWAIGFLPDDGILVTEKGGRLLHVKDGSATPVANVPAVAQIGQGGLLDVVVARDFAESREIFLSYSKPEGRGAKTALAVARLSSDGAALDRVREIFQMSAASSSGQHFGSRIVEAPDGTLFLTIGDRGDRPEAQNPQAHNGKVVRVNRDGTIPADNPFADGAQALPDIWSIGHRNPQGAALDETGRFWTVAHGARGGDEINVPEAGRNYGWPVISYGRHYTGLRIGEGPAKDGMEQPRHYWDPSIAPSGMMIYSGRLFPEWAGDIFVGSLKFDMISRLTRSGDTVQEAERLFQDTYVRIRDIREAPDGSIWFLAVVPGAAYRITPAPES
ncbi:MAG: PQQ-dependent sugar dehydrogenase [Pseudomonadota bacterium]